MDIQNLPSYQQSMSSPAPITPRRPKLPLILGIVVVVLALGYTALAKYQALWPFKGTSVTKETASPSTAASSNSSKTYTNAQYGFTFDYPATWTSTQNNDPWDNKGVAVIRLASPELTEAMKSCGVPCEASPYNVTVVVSNQNTWTLDKYVSGESDLNARSQTTLGGVPAIEGRLDGLSTYYVIYTLKDGRIYELYFDNTVDKTKLTEGERQILSTFRFTK